MAEIRVMTTANAGAVLRFGGLTIWADVLNEENEDGYEVLSEEAFQMLLSAPALRPDVILFTHRHPDHYSEEKLMRAVEAFPSALVFVGGGAPSERTVNLSAEAGSILLHILPLPHEGKAYEGVENDALLLESTDGTILIPGDCPVGCPELEEALMRHRAKASKQADFGIGLTLMNFPWLSLGKGRKALSALDPGHVLFFHLPAPQEDRYGYREQAERMLEQFRSGRDWRIAGKPFDEEQYLI